MLGSVLLAAGGASVGRVAAGRAGPDAAGQQVPGRASACVLPVAAAHRGASADEPENTVAAFARAIAVGAPDIELDVQWTRDGVPVVIHDPTVDRTTGVSARVDALTAGEVWGLDAGRGQRVPTLDVVLELAARHGARALVELKTVPTPVQVHTLLSVLRRAKASYVLHSFLPEALDAVRAVDPSVPTGMTTTENVDPAVAARYGAFLNVQRSQVDAQRVRAWHASGLKVFAWVADGPEAWEALSAAGADGIVTDRAAEYLEWARHKCAARP